MLKQNSVVMHIKLISPWIIFHVGESVESYYVANDVEQITENTSKLIKSIKVSSSGCGLYIGTDRCFEGSHQESQGFDECK